MLNNRYEVLKTIGRGGFAYVYLCQHVRNGQLKAVKEACLWGCGRTGTSLVGEDALMRCARGALLREVTAISRVTHPGVVRLEHLFEDNETLYFAMDFVEGEPLSTLLRRRDGVSDATFRRLSSAILDAVGQLHENDVLHGDIKPENIVVRPDKSIVLIDFGAAERLSDIDYTTPTFSPGYSAMERYRDGEHLGTWTDVYSCAATFAAALTGHSPPDATDSARDPSLLPDFLHKIPRRSPESLRWHDALASALAPSIKDRTSSVGLLSEAMGLSRVPAFGDSVPRAMDGHSILISYSHNDADIVETRVKALQLCGVSVWIDRQGIKPGSAAWGRDIVRGISTSQIMLVFSSCHSMASENVVREIYLADKLRKKIVVVLLDESPFNEAVSIFLTPIQHMRVEDTDDTAFAQAIVQILDETAGA